MKNILFVLHLPPPVHGVSQINSIIKESKIINGHFDCDYINLTTANDIADLGVRHYSKYFKVVKIIYLFIKKNILNKYDAIYISPSIPGPSFYKDSIFILLGKLLVKNIICHLHVQGFKEAINSSFFKKKYYSWVFRGVSVIHLSELLYKDISDVVDKENVYFVPNGVIPVDKLSLNKIKNIDPKSIQILFLSNMIEFKGPYLLLEVLNALLKKHNSLYNINIRFIGSWHDMNFKNKFYSYIENNNLKNNVEILGPIYGKDKYQYFRQADIFILPTNFEAFPLVLLEAMEFSLPIVSTNEGAISDIVENEITGFVVEKNNKSALVNKVSILLTDEYLRVQYGKMARIKFEQNYTSDVMEKNIYQVISKVILNS